MQTDIQSNDYALTEAIEHFTQWRLSKHLRHHCAYVRRVSVNLRNANGSKDGQLNQVKICVRLGIPMVVVAEATEDDLYDAIRIASRRARRGVARAVRKHKRVEKRALRRARWESEPALNYS